MARGGRNKRHGKRKRGASDAGSEGEATTAVTPRVSSPDSEIVEVAAAAAPSDDNNKRAVFERRWKTAEKTSEDVLKEQIATWTSDVYKHFQRPTITESRDGAVKYVFTCRTKPSISISRVRWDDSTSNLSRHVRSCTQELAAPGERIEQFAHGSTYSKARMRYLLGMWVSRRARPYVIVQDPELVEIFQMLYAKVEVPHPTTISRDVKEMFQITRKAIAIVLQQHFGKLHLCVDGWTSPNVISYLGVTVQRVVGPSLEVFILDFIKLTQGHTGNYLAQQLTNCLKEYGVEKKILGITADNASNNDTMARELEALGGMNSTETRVRCFAHVWNLVVKAIISPFIARRKVALSGDAGDDDAAIQALLTDDTMDENEARNDDDDELDADRERADEEDIQAIIKEVEEAHHLTREDDHLGRHAVTKLTELAKKMFHSPTMRADLASSCNEAGVTHKEMVRAVKTRWNSLVEAVKRALVLRNALEKFLNLPKYGEGRASDLTAYRLTTQEWLLLTQLERVLDAFLQATLRVSTSSKPLLHQVIPIIDVLTGHLENVAADKTLLMAVRAAAARGYAVLNKYYSKTDESVMYRLAVVLHPRYKLEYFRRQKWPADWIDEVKRLLRKYWDAHYKPTNATSSSTPSGPASATTSANDLFAEVDFFNVSDSPDPITEYLDTAPLGHVVDPIQFWNSQLAGGHPLASMALDFLSVPASSVDVERAFSRGGLTVSKRRHALSDESVRAATILGSWASVKGLIPEADILEIFRNKSKRTKKVEGGLYMDEDDATTPEVINIV